jgi:hypothetical protein
MQMVVNRGMDELWWRHTVNYYTAMKNEQAIAVSNCMDESHNHKA